MAKKDTTKTTRGMIRNRLRQLWMMSRERSTALKRSKYCCEKCGVKQSVAKGREQKIEVHHVCGRIDWEDLIDMYIDRVLETPGGLMSLCPECHKKEHTEKP